MPGPMLQRVSWVFLVRGGEGRYRSLYENACVDNDPGCSDAQKHSQINKEIVRRVKA